MSSVVSSKTYVAAHIALPRSATPAQVREGGLGQLVVVLGLLALGTNLQLRHLLLLTIRHVADSSDDSPVFAEASVSSAARGRLAARLPGGFLAGACCLLRPPLARAGGAPCVAEGDQG
jgi:hypothetical protein